MNKTGVTLITMGAGNVKVLRKTFESLSTICDEIVYGDMLIFQEDRELIYSYKKDFNLRIVPLPFDFIFKNGFAECLNSLAAFSTNNMVAYLNTSEVIEEDYGTLEAIKDNPDCNIFYFIHRTDPHRWFRVYNRKDLHWSGVIHEQLSGEYRPYHKPVFMMKDLEKDLDNPFKAKVFDTLKEAVYFHNYLKLVDSPHLLGETDAGWVEFVKGSYDSFRERLFQKGDGYKSLLEVDFELFLKYIYTDDIFKNVRFESSTAIEYQQSPMFLGKK